MRATTHEPARAEVRPLARRANVGLARFAKALVAATFLLIVAGGLVTSTGSGLAVPDWPTTYGQNMFTFPPSKWVGGIRYEHSHRLIASFVGLLTIVLCVWTLWREPRRWMKALSGIALAAVIVQGILGGLTVKYLLPTPISVAHGSLAQSFFCLTVAIATFLGSRWSVERARPATPDLARLHRFSLITTGIVFVQLVLGAVMRHEEAGLAIPDFPLSLGRIVPPLGDAKVALAFAHRAFALVVAVHVVLLGARALRKHRGDSWIVRPASLLIGLLVVQLTLGALTVLSGKDFLITTAHVAVGALVLAVCMALAIRSHRGKSALPETSLRAVAEVAPSRLGDYLALVKVRLTALVLATVAVGFYLATRGPIDGALLAWVVIGTGLLAGGASALNQLMEKDHDRDMHRTADRPIPAGRIGPREAFAAGMGLSVAGIALLWTTVNGLTALLGTLTLFLYLFAYTPLKRRTPWCTLVGAIPGAMPPVMGWSAARGDLGIEAAILFAILFVWQMPHFLAIAMIHRDDYARAGFPMLTVDDPDGATTARHIAAYCIAMIPVSLAPSMLGISGSVYFVGALVLGVAYLGLGLVVAIRRSRVAARGLFLASLVYLPILLGLLSVDKLR